jgi:Dolichyl-phosphate-mannose-protein mannosyltransferase
MAAASGRDAFHRLVSWDAQWYRGIAEHGYGFVRAHDGRLLADYAFSPLYPSLERLVAEVARLGYTDAGLLVSWVASLFAAWGIFAVGEHLYDARTGVLTACLWAALPVGVVESMAYSESLFTALAAWALYAVCRHWWLAAGFLGCLAGLTRPVGLAVVAAVAVPAVLASREALRRRSSSQRRWDRLAPPAAAALAPLGWLGYVGWVGWQRGGPTGYFDVANGWGNGIDGGATFAHWVWRLLTGSSAVSGVAVCVGVAVLLCLLAAGCWQRQPLPLLIYSVVILVAAFATSGYFGSKPRYLLPAFPLLLPVARWLARQSPVLRTSVVMLLAAASSVYGAVWLLGPGPP